MKTNQFAICISLATFFLIVVAPAAALPPCPCQSGCTVISGTMGNDSLTGTNGCDCINALSGDDVVYAKAGEDDVCGGYGDDDLYGDNDDDYLFAGPDDDVVYGGSGDDFLDGGLGFDFLATRIRGILRQPVTDAGGGAIHRAAEGASSDDFVRG